jgi:OmpA-OmpF porin, OOP family
MNTLIRLFTLCIALIPLLIGCAHEPPSTQAVSPSTSSASGATTSPDTSQDQLPTAGREQARISDGVILADKRFFTYLQKRLAELNAGGVPARNYHLSKAGAWLDFATEEYSDNDRDGVVEAALEQSVLLIRGLEAKAKNLPMGTPIIKGSRRIRDDLWARAERFKQHEQFACVADRVAMFEVQLVWAGHEDVEGGWRHAKPYIEIAEDMASQVASALETCPQPKAQAAEAAAEKPAAKSEPTPAVKRPEPSAAAQITLAADTLFRFNGATPSDIQTAAKKELDDLVAKLKGMGTIHRVLITGHSDRLGDAAYNLKLSQVRANTLRQVLIERGFAAELIQAAGAGESEPLVTCSGDRATPALIDCLQANRRVEIRVFATPMPAPSAPSPAGANR